MKKLAIVLCVALMLVLCSCAGAGEGAAFVDKGLEIATAMGEMAATDGYVAAMSASDEIKAACAIAGKDYSKPKGVYIVDVTSPEPDLDVGFSSDLLNRQLDNRIRTYWVNQLNGMFGVGKLAASAVLTLNNVFVGQEGCESAVYLFVYDGAYPIAVSYFVGEGGAVSATGNFLMVDDFSPANEAELEAALQQYGLSCKAKAVK